MTNVDQSLYKGTGIMEECSHRGTGAMEECSHRGTGTMEECSWDTVLQSNNLFIALTRRVLSLHVRRTGSVLSECNEHTDTQTEEHIAGQIVLNIERYFGSNSRSYSSYRWSFGGMCVVNLHVECPANCFGHSIDVDGDGLAVRRRCRAISHAEVSRVGVV